MLDRLKRIFKSDVARGFIVSILLLIFVWYQYLNQLNESSKPWFSWLSLFMVVIVSGMSALLLIHILLDVLFDVPTEKTEKVMQDVFNWVVASLFNIVGLLILIGIVFYLLGWLASIPAWAVVIIILLILLLLRL